MSTHGHTTIRNPTGGWSPARSSERGRRFVLAVTLLAGLFMTATGLAGLLAPSWSADAAGFPRHTHFVHDAGAFQLGIGITLLLAPFWHDGLALALAGSLVANATHAINHAVDLDLGGHRGDPWGLAALSLLVAAALAVRLGQLGWVVGEVTTATNPGAGTVCTPEDGAGDHLPPRRPTGGPPGEPGRRRRPRLSPQLREGRQAPVAARRAGAVDPSPGSRQDRQDGPFPADPLDPGQVHPNIHLLEAFYQAQAALYAGSDDTTVLRGLLADDIVWHVPGRSPIASHYHGHQEILGYFAARRAHAKATFRVQPRAILADDEWAVQLADGQLERGGQPRTWQTVGVFRIADGKIAECWLVPFDQYLFDELWS